MSDHQKEGYYCASCKLPYDTGAQYQEHLWSMLHHRVLENNGQKENHFCILCCETFRTLTDYSVHLINAKHRDAHSRWQRAQSGPSSRPATRKSFRSNWSEHTGKAGQGSRSTSYRRGHAYSYYSYKNHSGKKPYSRNRAYHVSASSGNVPSHSYERGLSGGPKRGNNSNRLGDFNDSRRSYSGHEPEWMEGEWTRTLQIYEKQKRRRFNRSFNDHHGRPSLGKSCSGKSKLNEMNGEAFNNSAFVRSYTPPESSSECFSEDVTFSQMESLYDVQRSPTEMQRGANFVKGNEHVQRLGNEKFDGFYGHSNNTEQEVEHGRSNLSNDQWRPKSMDCEEIVRNDDRHSTRKESAVGHGSLIVHVEVNKGCSECSSHSRQGNEKNVPPSVSASVKSLNKVLPGSIKQKDKPTEAIVCEGNKREKSEQRIGGVGSKERNEGKLPNTDNENTLNKSEVGITKNVESYGTEKMCNDVAGKPQTLDASRVEVLSNLDMSAKEGSIPSGRLELPSASGSVERVHVNLQESRTSIQDRSHKSCGNEMSTSGSLEVKTKGSPKQLFETQLNNHSNHMSVSSVTKSNTRDPEQQYESKLDNCIDVMSSNSLTQSIVGSNGVDKISDGKQTPGNDTFQNNQMSTTCTSAFLDTTPPTSAPSDKVPPVSSTISSGSPGAGRNGQMSTTTSPTDTISSSSAPCDKVPPVSGTVSSGPTNTMSGAGTIQDSQMSTTCTSVPSEALPLSTAPNDILPPESSTISAGPLDMTLGEDMTLNGQISTTSFSDTVPSSSAPNDKVPQALRTISSGPSNLMPVVVSTQHGHVSTICTSAPLGSISSSSSPNDKVPPASNTTSSGPSNKMLLSVTSTSQLKLPDLIQKLLKKQSSKPNLDSARLSHPRESSGLAIGDLKRVLLGLFESPVPQHYRKLQEEQLKKLFAKAGSSSDRFKKFGVHLEMADTEEDEMIKVLEKLTEEDLELLAQNESHDILHELLSLYEVPGEIPPDHSLQTVTPSSKTLPSVASSSVTALSVASSSVTSSSLTPCTVSNLQPTQQCTEQTTTGKPEEVVHIEHREEFLVSSESEDDDVAEPPQPAEIDQAVYGQVFQLSCEENELRQLLKGMRKELRALESKIREYTEKAKALKAKKVETKKKMKSVRKNRLKLTTDHVKQSTQGVSPIPVAKDSATKPSSQKNMPSPLSLQGPKPKGAVSVMVPKESCPPETLAKVPVPQLPVIKPGSQHSLSGPSLTQPFPHQHTGISSPTPPTSGLNVFEPSSFPGIGPNYGVGQIIPPEAMGISIQRISEEEVMKLVQMQGVTQTISSRETATGEKSSDTSQPLSTDGTNLSAQGKKHQEGSINAQQGPLLPGRPSQAFGMFSQGTSHPMSQIIPSETISQPQFTSLQHQQQHALDQRLSNNTNPELLDQVQVTPSSELQNRSSRNSDSPRPPEGGESSSFSPYPVGIIKVKGKQPSSLETPLENRQNGHARVEALSGDNMKQTHGRNLKTVIKKEPDDDGFIADQNYSDKQKLPGHSEPQASVPSCSAVIKVEPVDPSESTSQQEVHTTHGRVLRPRKVLSRTKNLTETEDAEGLKESNEDPRPTSAKRLCTSVSSNTSDCVRQLRSVSVRCKDITLQGGIGLLKESVENSRPSSSERSLASVASRKRGRPSLTSSSKEDEAREETTPKVDGNASDAIQDLKVLKKKLKLEKKKKIASQKREKFLKRLNEYKVLGLSKSFMEIAEKRSQAKKQDRRALQAEVNRLQQARKDSKRRTLWNFGSTKPTEETGDKNSSVVASSESGESAYLKALLRNCRVTDSQVNKQRNKAAKREAKKAKRVAQLRSVGIPEDLLDIIKKGGSATKAEAARLNKEMSKNFQKELSSLKRNKKGRSLETKTSQNQIKQNGVEGNQKVEKVGAMDVEDSSSSGVVTRKKTRACNKGSTTTVNEAPQEETSGEHSLRSKGKRHLHLELCQEKAILGLHGCFEKLYAYSVDGSTRCLNLSDLKEQKVYSGHKKQVTGLHVFTDSSRNMNLLFTSSQDQKLLCFNLENNELLHTHTFKQPITCMVGMGESLFLGLANGHVELFHAQKLLSYESYVCHNKEITCLAIAFITGSQLFLSGATDGSLAIHSVTSGTLKGSLRGHQSSVLCVQVTGIYVLSGASDGRLLQHHIMTKQIIKEYSCHQAAITDLLVQGNFLYTACLDNTVRVIKLKKKQIFSKISVDKVLSLCLYKQKIYVGRSDGSVLLLPSIPSDKTASSSKKSSPR